MLRFILLIAGCAVVVLLSGCLLPQQQVEFKAEIQSLDQRLRTIEQRPAQQGAQLNDGQQLNNIGRQQANLKAELDSLRVDVQTLVGRLEDQQHNMNQLREELSLAQNDLSLQVAQLANRKNELLPPASKPVVVASAPIVPVAAPLVQPGANITSTQVPVANNVQVPPALQDSDAATALYQQALQLVQHQGEFSQSRELFTKFIQQYPNHSLAINAMYWVGETYYGDKKYENAILQFQDVIQKYPQHPKVPAALMKQGLAFYALGDVRNARVILQKVVEQYPATPEADKAQERLTSWQGQN